MLYALSSPVDRELEVCLILQALRTTAAKCKYFQMPNTVEGIFWKFTKEESNTKQKVDIWSLLLMPGISDGKLSLTNSATVAKKTPNSTLITSSAVGLSWACQTTEQLAVLWYETLDDTTSPIGACVMLCDA